MIKRQYYILVRVYAEGRGGKVYSQHGVQFTYRSLFAPDVLSIVNDAEEYAKSNSEHYETGKPQVISISRI